MTTTQDVNAERKLASGAIVTRFRIIGTTMVVHEAYEPTRPGPVSAYSHGTIMHFGDEAYGKVTTRNLPADMAAMPRGEARTRAVQAWYEDRARESYSLIEEAFPEVKGLGDRSMGGITFYEGLPG